MAGLNKQTLEQIRDANDIADVVGSYIPLKRAGTALKALCPFHKEKTPSFTVNPQRQIFHCFGCGVGGDVFKFVMLHENMDFMSAVRLLARRAGIQVQFDDEATSRETGEKERLYKLHEALAQFYHRVLMDHSDGEAARTYLKNRHLDNATIKDFLIGFAPARPHAMQQWAKKNKYELKQLEAGGIIAIGDGGPDDIYDRFQGRLMFPIRDEQGRVIAFSGRVLRADQHPAKYVNSPETPLFRKSRVLFAFDKARRPILDSRTALICEGQIDVIRCHAAGIKTAVAALGTALTEDHARLLKRYADSVTLVMDADTAGQNSAIRSSEVFIAGGLAVHVATLPPGEDPDSLVLKEGAAGLQKAIDRATSALDFHIDVLTSRENTRTEEGIMRVSHALLESIARAPSAVQQDQLIRRAAGRLGIAEQSLRDDFARVARTATPRQTTAVTPPPKKSERPPEEVELIRILAHHPECVNLVRDYLPLAEVSDPVCRTIIHRTLEGEENLTALATTESEACGQLIAAILAAGSRVAADEGAPEAAIKDLILRIRRRTLEQRRKEMEARRARTQGPEQEQLNAEIAQLILDISAFRRGWQHALPILELNSSPPPLNPPTQ